MLKYNRSVHYSQTVREAEALSMLPQGQRTGSHPRLQPGKCPLSVGFGRGRSVSWIRTAFPAPHVYSQFECGNTMGIPKFYVIITFKKINWHGGYLGSSLRGQQVGWQNGSAGKGERGLVGIYDNAHSEPSGELSGACHLPRCWLLLSIFLPSLSGHSVSFALS